MKNTFNDAEIKAMLKLLDDEDENIYQSIERHFLEMGREIIPRLEEYWSNSFDAVLQSRIEKLVHKIQFESLKNDLHFWHTTESDDLLKGLIIISRYQYPDLKEQTIKNQLNEISGAIASQLDYHLIPTERIKIFNQVFYNIYGFNGNTVNFHAPQNSFINTVLESKKGSPILLCAIYSILATENNLPVFGVNIPEHFILCYKDSFAEPEHHYTYPEYYILFYINAFSKGNIFSKTDIDTFLQKLNLQPQKSFYVPCTNTDIIKRILRNLHYSFTKSGDAQSVHEIEQLLTLMEE